MDERRIDGLARLVARTSTSRRRVFAVAAGLAALARHEVVASPPVCQPENTWCTHWLGCCDGLVCTMQLTSPHLGVCLPGEDVYGTGFVFAGLPVPSSTGSTSSNRETPTSTPTSTPTPRPTRTPTPTPTPTSGGNGNGNGDGKNNKNNETNRNKKKRKNDRDDKRKHDHDNDQNQEPDKVKRVAASLRLRCGTANERVIVDNTGSELFKIVTIKTVRTNETLVNCGETSECSISSGKSQQFDLERNDLSGEPVFSADGPPNDGVILQVVLVSGSEQPFEFRGYCDGRATKALGPVRLPGNV